MIVPGARVRLTANWSELCIGDELIILQVDGAALLVGSPCEKKEIWIPSNVVESSVTNPAWTFRPSPSSPGTAESAPAPTHKFIETDPDTVGHRNNSSLAIMPVSTWLPSSVRSTTGEIGRPWEENAPVPRSMELENGQIRQDCIRQDANSTTDSLPLEIAHHCIADTITAADRYHFHGKQEVVACSPATAPLFVMGNLPREGIESLQDRADRRLYASVGRMQYSTVGASQEKGIGSSQMQLVRTDHDQTKPDPEQGNGNISRKGNSGMVQSLADLRILSWKQRPDRCRRTNDKPRKSTRATRTALAHPTTLSPSGEEGRETTVTFGWEAEQFTGRYLELEELGSGRFAKVRRAKDRGTGQEVALKQICRQRQARRLTQAEYELLASTRHDNIVRAYAFFENAPRPGIDTIVLELVRGSTSLVAYLCETSEYTERTVARYGAQLFSALAWLHARGRAHLDLKPENILVDRENGMTKLIDLGEAVRLALPPLQEVVPPADLEFAAPESVLGKPTGPTTDMWAAGVFLYVLLSGFSPFLDDSVEETTTNILKCDFCFPEEYFTSISNHAKDLLGRLLCLREEDRATAEHSLVSPWFQISPGAQISSSRMTAFVERRACRSNASLQCKNTTFYP